MIVSTRERPVSRTSTSMNSSWRRMRILSARRITFARSSNPAAAQAGCAARARCTAARTSAAEATAISPIFSFVTGLDTRRRRGPPVLSIDSTMAIRTLLRTWSARYHRGAGAGHEKWNMF